ncbi:FAD/NAD(P)-binding protein [Acidipropionibacterium jensenii]|uniref:FAD/NAD(P)-binding protein n=1 Tax=Acidipropionibacterium jensenii TaxID=1749 RepID=UPI00214C5CBD|nr:FAD/NAD(P)-binding protein [Acidipropionibacterium jensenii]
MITSSTTRSAQAGPAPTRRAAVALVGVGPRAVAVAARLVADHDVLAPGVDLDIHLIDAVEIGAGRTWRTDQNRLLLNNTYAAETTVFADETIPTAGPTDPGPSLAQWLAEVAAHPEGHDPDLVAEARGSRPWSFPSRAIQGSYFHWALAGVIDSAPPMIRFVKHIGRVVRLEEGPDGSQLIALREGPILQVDAVVLAQGLVTSDRTPQTRELKVSAGARGLRYLPPGMPSERDWDQLPAGEPVIVRGLGANFFDLVGVLFEGRGGRFERDEEGELRYLPSGREPHLIAGSRRGLPYRGKAYYDTGLPETIELPRFSAAREAQLIADHDGRADLDFGATQASDLMADFRDVYDAAARAAGVDEPFDWDRIVFPADHRSFPDEASWTDFLDRYIELELQRIRHPEASPQKAVHRAMETARRRISRLVTAGVLDPCSVVRDLKQKLLRDSLVIASGPPPERVERFACLVRAGLIEVLGPGLSVAVTPEGFEATTSIPGQRRTARALAEARMRLGDLRTTDDPLIRQLLDSGQARFHRAASATGTVIETDTLDVTSDRFLLIDAAGQPHRRRIVLGPPAGDVQFYSAIGAIPHTGDKMLIGAERAAAQLLELVAGGKDADNSELEKAGSHETGAGFPVTWRTDTDHQGF